MRLTRPLAVLIASTVLLTALTTESAQAQDKNAQIATAYKKARQLYRQGKYQKAIRAFDEVKDLRYHPILDYGIAGCYEGLRDFNKAIYYLRKYLRNHPKHKMSPKHPSVADVTEKIKTLEERAKSPAPGPGTTPDPVNPGTTGTPASGGLPGDPVPGPDPYAVPPPPGGGTTGGVYGSGGGAAPPPPPGGGTVRRQMGPARRSLILSVDFGAAAFAAGGTSSNTADGETGGGVFFTALWRMFPFLAVGVHGGFAGVGSSISDYNPLLFAVGVVEARGILPLGRFDIYGSLGLGYGSISQSYYDVLNSYDGSVSYSGPALAIAVGIDWFLSRTFSVGVIGRVYKMFPTRYCINDYTYGDTCGDLADDTDPGIAWYAGLAVTYHLPLMFGRRH